MDSQIFEEWVRKLDRTHPKRKRCSNGEEMSLVISKFEKLFTEDRIASKKQKNICDFFKPVWF